MSYGFRGEALASIAAVAEVTLKTRREQDESGTQVVIGDSGKLRSSGVSTPKGSNFIIRNLFYNTPARRKFLKGDNVELRHIVDEFVHIAVPHPEIAFSLVHNGRQLYVLKKRVHGGGINGEFSVRISPAATGSVLSATGSAPWVTTTYNR